VLSIQSFEGGDVAGLRAPDYLQRRRSVFILY
jgi:hypothetical protein